MDVGLRPALNTMVTAYGRAWTAVGKEADALLKHMEEALANGEDVSPSWLFRQERYRALQDQCKDKMDEFADAADRQIMAAEKRAAALGIKSSAALAKASYATQPPGLDVHEWSRINHSAAEAMAVWTHNSGAPLRELFGKMGDWSQIVAENVLTSGVIAGKGAAVIARDLRDQIAAMTLQRAQLIARTEVHRASRVAQSESFKANPAVKGWTWFAALDSRTCAVCWGMHGQVFPTNEPLAGHPACRCTMVPKTKTWAELGFDGVDEIAPNIESGEAQFARLPPSVQRQILGPTRFGQYAGGITKLSDMLRKNENPTWGPSYGLQGLPARVPPPPKIGQFDHWANEPNQLAHWKDIESRMGDLSKPVQMVDKDGNPATSWQTLGGGITKTYYGMVDGIMCVVKPEEGMNGGPHPGIPDGNGVGREVGAYTLFRQFHALDSDFWLDFPVVTGRDVPGLGSTMLMELAKNVDQGRYSTITDRERNIISFYDGLIGAADRHGGNWLVNKTDGHFIPIDHGNSFPDASVSPWNHAFNDSSKPLTGAQITMLSKWLADKSTPEHALLKSQIGDLAYKQLLERGQYMLDASETLSYQDLSAQPWYTDDERKANEKAYGDKLNGLGLESLAFNRVAAADGTTYDRYRGHSGEGEDPQPGDDWSPNQNLASMYDDWWDLDDNQRAEMEAQGYREPEYGSAWDIAMIDGRSVVVRERMSDVSEPSTVGKFEPVFRGDFPSNPPSPAQLAWAKLEGSSVYTADGLWTWRQGAWAMTNVWDIDWAKRQHAKMQRYIAPAPAIVPPPVVVKPPVVAPVLPPPAVFVGAEGGFLDINIWNLVAGGRFSMLSEDERGELKQMNYVQPTLGGRWRIILWRGQSLLVGFGKQPFDPLNPGSNHGPVGVRQMSGRSYYHSIHYIEPRAKEFDRMTVDERIALVAAGFTAPVPGEPWRKVRDPLHKNWVIVRF